MCLTFGVHIMDEERPLRSSKDESATVAIQRYMRLFDRYSSVEAQIKQAAKAEDEKETFRKSTQEYNHIRAAKMIRKKPLTTHGLQNLNSRNRA